MMSDHVSNLTMSQLCSFITLHMLSFLFLMLCWLPKHFTQRHFWAISACWALLGLHWRSGCAFSGATVAQHCCDLCWAGFSGTGTPLLPTMLGCRRGSICLFHVLLFWMMVFFSYSPMRQGKGWTDPLAEGETLLRQMVAQWWVAVIYFVYRTCFFGKYWILSLFGHYHLFCFLGFFSLPH